MKNIIKVLIVVGCAILLFGCAEKIVPVFDEDAMREYAVELADKLTGGDVEYVYDLVIEKHRIGVPLENVESLVQGKLDQAGEYDELIKAEFTESRNPLTKEPVGSATVYQNHEKGIIIYNFSFDEEINLLGIGVRFQLR